MPAMFGLGSGGTTINYPQQQGYGEALSESLKAQVDLLKGEGEFSGTGGMQRLLTEYEAPVRKTSAQIDTDVLETTLLGGNETFDESGRILEGYKTKEGEVIEGENPVVLYQYGTLSTSGSNSGEYFVLKPGSKPQGFAGPPREEDILFRTDQPPYTTDVAAWNKGKKDFINKIKDKGFIDDSQYNSLVDQLGDSSSGLARKGFHQATVPNPKINIPDSAVPIYKKDEDGNEIVRTDLAGKTVRMGDGMVDLLGDNRNVEEFTTRQATQEDVAAGLASEVGESITEATGGRKAGFDAEGNFLGLAALSEDIQRGNLSRQREADLTDVERLSDRYRGVMEDYKPAATSGLDDARILLEQQRENLTGLRKATQADVDQGLATEVGEMFQTGTGSGGPVTIPKDDTYGGDVTGATMDAANVGQAPTLDAKTSFKAADVADPLQLTANTQFQGQLATGAGNNDTLRSALLGDAKTALDTGLTDREQAQIANAARARQTLMGRTFDQSGAIAEAEARVQEDNTRRMQNRSFAQSVLGQEAGLQQGDITRGMAQESEQAGLNQRRDLAQSQLDQDALRTSMLTGVQQDLDQAKFDQQRNLAQAELDQQANAFGAQSTQQARMANQAQRQQANQFGVGAEMDAERLNETLRQQGLSNYINAVGNLAQMEDQYMLDPFQALLGRGGGNALQQGQSVFGQANYGLSSGPQYLNPEAGLGYISQMAANDANMYAANVAGDASRTAGIFGGLGSLGGGLLMGAGAAGGFGSLFCWVAREVYGPTNPAWMQFREWMFTESPQWFFELYRKYGERFASWISDKPRLKGIIRKWMDSKIGDK